MKEWIESMNESGLESNASSQSNVQHLVGKLWGCLQDPTPHEQYLASATDHADLERRMRLLERMGDGSMFVTFNH
jgi:hypothetical protein